MYSLWGDCPLIEEEKLLHSELNCNGFEEKLIKTTESLKKTLRFAKHYEEKYSNNELEMRHDNEHFSQFCRIDANVEECMK